MTLTWICPMFFDLLDRYVDFFSYLRTAKKLVLDGAARGDAYCCTRRLRGMRMAGVCRVVFGHDYIRGLFFEEEQEGL
jgi:hypothetical protein